MSKHTDTGRAGTRRAGKKLWILIPVIAVLVIAASTAATARRSTCAARAFRRKGIFVCASSCRTAKYTGTFPSAAR